MYRKISQGWLKHWDFILLDVACLLVSIVLAYLMRNGIHNLYMDRDYVNISIVFALTDLVVLVLSEPMKNVLKRSPYRELAVTIKHILLVALIVSFYLFSTKTGSEFSRLFYYYLVMCYFLTGYTGRLLWKAWLLKRMTAVQKNSLFIVATAETAKEAEEKIRRGSHGAYALAGMAIIDEKPESVCGQPDGLPKPEQVPDTKDVTEKCDAEVLLSFAEETAASAEKPDAASTATLIHATTESIIAFLKKRWVDEVYIALPPQRACPERLLETLAEMGITVHIDLGFLYHLDGQKQFVEHTAGTLVLTSSMSYMDTWQAFFKRTLDILGGLVGCLITGILCIFIGPLIYLQSPGPVFFKQTRVGRNGRRFTMYKFRSMYLDAEERKKELLEQNRIKDGLMFKLEYDPRIIGARKLPDGTVKKGIGNFIRNWSLDEFPQFLNVLKGDMSLVGTRPPTEDEWEKYEPHHRARLCIRPGITGLWQVSGRSEITDFEEVVRLDKKYISEWSMELDMKILARTIGVVLGKDGAM